MHPFHRHSSIWVVLPILIAILLAFVQVVPIMCMTKYETVGMIPKQRFEEQQVIYAFTERIIDGDTIRVRHIPNYLLRHYLLRCFYNHQQTLQPLHQRGIAQETLSIRLYGVDCPELAKKKQQVTQPFAKEAKEFTAQLCLHKVVRITLLRKDQYQRAVALVQVLPNTWFGGRAKDVSLALAQAGLAELYTGGGAEYAHQREALQQAIQRAQRKRTGIWSLPNRVSAADYKRMEKDRVSAEAPHKLQQQPRRGNLLETAITGLEVMG